MCWHKWTKWETYKVDMKRYFPKTQKIIDYIETCQKRVCKKCGLEQNRKVK